ncbi:MAG: 8-oxo-dGTP diphosphatase [Deltaproteobacteria bacterium]|nr:8-oxo-dGTP diphosphatase [Deltaproteobacteria bacterium]
MAPSKPVPRRVDEIEWSSWVAVDTATLVFIVVEGRALLIRKKRGLGAGKINGPGGRLESGETPVQCAIREVEEELLITPQGLRKGGESRFQFVDGYSIHVHVFQAAGYSGEPTETDEAIPLWFDLENLPYEEMWEDDELWLPLLFAGSAFDGRFIFEGDRMLDHRLEVTA